MLHCLLVGGLNAGKRLNVRADGKFIELKTVSHLKPITRAGEEPEPVYVKDAYELHPLQLVDSDTDKPTTIMLGVTAGKRLTWGVGELIRAYCESVEIRRKENDETEGDLPNP